jgi:hypothetical protein
VITQTVTKEWPGPSLAPKRSPTDLFVGDTVFSKFNVFEDNGTMRRVNMEGDIISVNTNGTFQVKYTDEQIMDVSAYNLTRCKPTRST